MKLAFTDKEIDAAPKGYTRIRLTEGEARRLVLKKGAEALEIGVGPWEKVTRRKFILIARMLIGLAKQHKLKKIAVQFSRSPFPQLKDLPLAEIGATAAQAFEMANFEPVEHKTPPREGWNFVDEVLVCGKTPAAMKEAFREGKLIGEEVNAARVLANTPGGDMTPTVLAEAAAKALKGTGATVKALGPAELRRLGAGGILGVARGSDEEPRLILIEYKGGGEKEPIALVGKGVTFDTGGLNLKGESGIYEMHMDMSGGAAVIHAIAAAARLGRKVNVVGIIPAVENMPSGSAYHPGDILTSLSGKTIEILNTDAEGRVILADGITYAKRYKPRLLVTVATLTGAVLGALGQQASGLLTRDQRMEKLFREAGEESGDYVWPLPMWDEYEEMVKGNFGDVANITTVGNSRYGGVISGGMFLWQFAKDVDAPFVHIDMASRMTSAPNEHLAKGAAGAPVRLLLKVMESA